MQETNEKKVINEGCYCIEVIHIAFLFWKCDPYDLGLQEHVVLEIDLANNNE